MERSNKSAAYTQAIEKAKQHSNPKIRRRVNEIVQQQTDEHQRAVAERVCGLSLTATIYHALLRKRLVKKI